MSNMDLLTERYYNSFIPKDKYSIPDLNSLRLTFRRNALIDRMFQSEFTKVFLISGGTGTGKTTLVKQIIAGSTRPVLWLCPDESDRGLSLFLSLLFRAIETSTLALSDSDRQLLPRLQHDRNPLLLAPKVAEILGHAGIELVIDDYQKVAEEPEIQTFVDGLIHYLPLGCKVFLCSRRAVSFPRIHKWRMEQWLVEIGEEELCCTPADIEQLLQLANIADPGGDLRTRLYAESKGWIGILILLIGGLKRAEDRGSYRTDAIDYIRHELVHEIPHDYAEFIIETSLFTCLIPHELDHFLGRNDSEVILEHLAGNNWFTQKFASEPRSYRYHDLLSDCAQQLLNDRYSTTELDHKRRRVAEHLATYGHYSEAIREFLRCDAIPEAVALLNQTATTDGATDNPLIVNPLVDILDDIPASAIRDYPELLFIKGRKEFMKDRIENALSLLTQAIIRYQAEHNYAGAICAYSFKIYILQFVSRIDELLKACHDALELPVAATDRYRMRIQIVEEYHQAEPDLEQIKRLFEQCLEIAVRENDGLRIATESTTLATAYYRPKGRLEVACEIYEQYFNVFKAFYSWESFCSCRYNLALSKEELGQFRRAIVEYRALLKATKEYRMPIFAITALAGLVKNFSLLGRFDIAARYRRTIKKLIVNYPISWTKIHFYSCSALFYAEKDHEQSALHYADMLLNHIEHSGDQEQLSFALTIKAETALRFGRWQEARTATERYWDRKKFKADPYSQALYQRLKALQVLGNDNPQARNDLRDFMRICMNNSFDFLVMQGPYDLRLLLYALAQNIEKAYARRILQNLVSRGLVSTWENHPVAAVRETCHLVLTALNGEAEPPSVDARQTLTTTAYVSPPTEDATEGNHQPSLPPLRIQCFNKFQVWIGNADEPIPDSAWRISHAKKILKYLLIHNRQPVHREVLVDTFWPNSSLEFGLNNLYNAISILRRTLLSAATRENRLGYIRCKESQYSLLLPSGSDVDFYRFERLLNDVKQLLKKTDLPQALERYLEASNLNAGEFLAEDIYEDWPMETRQRLKVTFASTGLLLAEQLLTERQLSHALDVAAILSHKDPYNEEALSIFMKAQVYLGHRTLALGTFDRYRKKLLKDMNCEPGVYLTRLYEKLKTTG